MKDRIVIFYRTQILKLKSTWSIIKPRLKKESFFKKILIILSIPYRTIKVLLGLEFNIPYIEIVLTTYCNLKCNGCSALMPRYKKPEHFKLEDNIKAIQKIIDSCDSINHLRLLGGEPLCYPDLYNFLVFLKKQDKIKRIAIVTNGTMTITDKKLINLLKDNKFYFSISNYGEVSRNYDNLIEQLNKNKIKYVPMSMNYEWIDYGDFTNRKKSEKVLKKQYNYCTHRVRSLLNGKLFQCFRCSHATNLKLISLVKGDYVDVFDESLNKKELRKKLYKFVYRYTPYLESCKFCDCNNNPKIIPRGKQTIKINNKEVKK